MEQLGAAGGTEGVEAFTELALDLVQVHGTDASTGTHVQHWEAKLQDLPAGVEKSMGAAVMGKMLRGIDPARFERLADGA